MCKRNDAFSLSFVGFGFLIYLRMGHFRKSATFFNEGYFIISANRPIMPVYA